MKKIVFENEESKIHINDVHWGALICVKKKGNDFGFMVNPLNITWFCYSVNGNVALNNISDACKWFGSNCEFYVLE